MVAPLIDLGAIEATIAREHRRLASMIRCGPVGDTPENAARILRVPDLAAALLDRRAKPAAATP